MSKLDIFVNLGLLIEGRLRTLIDEDAELYKLISENSSLLTDEVLNEIQKILDLLTKVQIPLVGETEDEKSQSNFRCIR